MATTTITTRRDLEIAQALAERTPEEIEEQRRIQELIGQGIDSATAFRVVTAKPRKGSGRGKRLNYDPSFCLLK